MTETVNPNMYPKMRVIAMKALYAHLLTGKDIRKCVTELTRTNNIPGYLYSLTVGTVECQQEYEEKISALLRKDWSLDRLSKLDLAILLMSMHEILDHMEPKAPVINEAVNLAKKYSGDDSYKLINGILDRV